MHFKTCTECNALIPIGTTECPHCNEPQSKTEYIFITIGIVLVLALFAYSASFVSFEEKPKETKLEPIIKIRDILGKEKYMVDAYLQKPQACMDEINSQERCYYPNNIEILYTQSKANWIKIEKIQNVAHAPKALELLDISVSNPTLKNDYVMTWTHAIRGIYEVSIFGNQGLVSAIHIHANKY